MSSTIHTLPYYCNLHRCEMDASAPVSELGGMLLGGFILAVSSLTAAISSDSKDKDSKSRKRDSSGKIRSAEA